MHNIYIDNNGKKWDGLTCNTTGMTKCELDTDGKPYSNYNLDGTPDVAANAIDNIVEVMLLGEQLAKAHIQAPIDAYNEVHGVKFDSVHNCSSYRDHASYSHKPFCIDIWAFNVDVWEAVRSVQDGLIAGIPPNPTPEEFIALLPGYTTLNTTYGLGL